MYTNGKISYNSDTAGAYLGSDGIGLGTGKFYVDAATGHLVCTSATIGGITVDANSIHSTNGNFKVTDSGYAEFKNVFVSGVNNGSSFGTVSVSDKGTYGNFGNGFAANTSFDVSGGALTGFADCIRATKILAKYVETSELDATNARIKTLESDHVSTSDLDATNAEIKNLKSASITADRLKAGTVNGKSVKWQEIRYIGAIEPSYGSAVNSSGETISVVKTIGYSSYKLYVMCHDEKE